MMRAFVPPVIILSAGKTDLFRLFHIKPMLRMVWRDAVEGKQ